MIGKEVRINGRSFTLIGVAPKSFAGLEISSHAEAVVPVGSRRQFATGDSDNRTPLSLAKAVEKQIEALDSHRVLRSQTPRQRSARALLQERMVALLSAFFRRLAVLMANSGLYGLTA